MMIVAHRGASKDAPENTVPAFNLAWEQGADAIEGDFRLTQDGHIVCIHDTHTKRVAGVKLAVRSATLAELRALDVGARRGEAFRGTVIPTIAEVFATVPAQKRIFIEIKSGPAILPRLFEEIAKSGLADEQIVLISFSKRMIKTLKKRAPRFKALWLSHFKQDRSGQMVPSVDTVLAALEQIGADGFSSAGNIVGDDLIRRVKAEGYEYHVWTVDDPQAARNFAQHGVTSITTNRPAYIRQTLAAEAGPQT